jgi:hypothetical protein
MKRIGSALGTAVLFSTAVFASAEISPQGKKVVDYLLDDWAEHMHSTSIPLAMQNLGMEPDERLRLEIGQYLRENTHLANNLKWWGANNYLLNHEEKLLAKYLIHAFERQERLPSLAELGEALHMPEDRLKSRLSFLSRAGLLDESTESPPGYALTRRYARWGGPLRYNFHAITIGQGKPFEVW